MTAQTSSVSQVWNPDLGDGRYKNPVLYADYSDPDITRVGEDFYLVSSSFDAVPGLPILHSRDLVHWEIAGHVYKAQPPLDVFAKPQHGGGAWAPSIRFHAGEFFLYWPDPDLGIYMSKAKSVAGPWSAPLLIKAQPGWIDPCPLWDDDGQAYMINAAAGSRGGVKSVVLVSRMSPDGTRLLDDAAIVIDGHDLDPTIEGPKIYKRHGFYYISAPAGGVGGGWQVVYRSKTIYGPYERRVVLAQGSTPVNGPHQGGWVDTAEGEDWFMHFQDQGAYGRVVHLEPMTWKDDWPVIGQKIDAAGKGEPVATFRKPAVKHPGPPVTPLDSDEFNTAALGPQWQWQANAQPDWAFPSSASGTLRLIATPNAGEENLWKVPNLVMQKFPADQFRVTTRLTFTASFPGEETGLIVMGQSYAYVGIRSTPDGLTVREVERRNAIRGGPATESAPVPVPGKSFYLSAQVTAGAKVQFSYSLDGTTFQPIGPPFQATAGVWTGARIGLFAISRTDPAKSEFGFADYDWFRFSH